MTEIPKDILGESAELGADPINELWRAIDSDDITDEVRLQLVEAIFQDKKSEVGVHALTQHGFSLFYLAVSKNRLNIIKYWVEQASADVNKVEQNKSPLSIACEKGHADMVTYFLEKNADVNFQDPVTLETPIFLALFFNQTEAAKRLLQVEGINLELKTEQGFSPVQCAASLNRWEILPALLDKKANPNVSVKGGTTPLHVAAEQGYWKCVEQLLKAGAVQKKNDEGFTPTDLAVANNQQYAKNILDGELASKGPQEQQSLLPYPLLQPGNGPRPSIIVLPPPSVASNSNSMWNSFPSCAALAVTAVSAAVATAAVMAASSSSYAP